MGEAPTWDDPGAPPGLRGEPAVRRNRPPEHRRWAGRRGPSDGGSRVPIGQGGCLCVFSVPGGEEAVEAADSGRCGASPAWGTRWEAAGTTSLEAPLFKNQVSEIVRKVAWKTAPRCVRREREGTGGGPPPACARAFSPSNT